MTTYHVVLTDRGANSIFRKIEARDLADAKSQAAQAALDYMHRDDQAKDWSSWELRLTKEAEDREGQPERYLESVVPFSDLAR